MEAFKTPVRQIIKDFSKNSSIKTFGIKKSKIRILENLFNNIKPADPLINRKNIIFKPIKYPSVNKSVLKLPNFNDNAIPYIEKFDIISSKEAKSNNINNLKKDYNINHYINTNKMISKLIYAKNPKDKEGNFTIDNFINLTEIYDSKTKRTINKENIKENEDNLNKLDINQKNIINFESNFECGNLQLVYLINNNEEEITNNNDINKKEINAYEENNNYYELFLQNDTNTKGHSQWFFFRITKKIKGKKIKINIMNFQRKTTKYSIGIKIWYFSKKKKEEKNIGWHHTTETVEYFPNFLYNFIKGKRYYYYTLSFEYTFEYDNDEIYFANSIPFTYSDVIQDLNYYTKKENETYNFFERKKLCNTLLGNDVDYFTINKHNNILLNDINEKRNKKGIILFARQHPGETISSWVLKGACEYLMNFNEEANYLRDNYIIKIIPMINVDGVICGNSRTSLSGCDLNRRWVIPDEFLHPEIYYLKELIRNFSKNVNVEYIIDFHAHFGAFNSFFYGNHNNNDLKYCKRFPFVCGKISDVILFDKSCFKMPKFKKGTGRIHLFNELSIENIFTLETSYFGCNQGKYNNQYFNIDILKEIGRDICRGILLCNYNSDMKLNTNLKNDIIKIDKEFDKYINNFSNKNQDYCEEKEEQEKEKEDISDSESEPSRDNLDEEEIKKLLPFYYKKKIIKTKKRRKINAFLRNGNNSIKRKRISKLKEKLLNIQRDQTIAFPKLEKKSPITTFRNIKEILTINNTTNSTINNNTKRKNINEDISSKYLYKHKKYKYLQIFNKKYNTNFSITTTKTIIKSFEEKETQTEEKFFSFHWSYFLGIYKIITPCLEKKQLSIIYPLLVKYDQVDYLKQSKLKSTSTMISSTFNKIKLNLKENNKNINGRNNKYIKYIYKSENEKSNYINSLLLKNDYRKIFWSENNGLNSGKSTSIKNKLKNRENHIHKIISSFVSNCTAMKKDDYLKNYLDEETRNIFY